MCMLESAALVGENMLRKILAFIVLFTVTAAASQRQSNADYRARRHALAAAMSSDHGTIILFAPLEPEGQNDLYGFRQEDNFYYLTGWAEPGAAVVITSSPYS